MSTTTIRIEDSLKQRVAAMADRAGKTAHAFIVDAIAETVEQAERKAEAHRIADERWGKALATGKTVPWNEAKAYLAARAEGTAAKKPVARKLGNPHGAGHASSWRWRCWTTSTVSSRTWRASMWPTFPQDWTRSSSHRHPGAQPRHRQAGEGRKA